MDQQVIDAARAAFQQGGAGIQLGACVHGGATHPEPLIAIPLAMMNRHGLIAGATGTGKTKTLQLIAEQLSAAGVPVFVADVKGDLSGVATPGDDQRPKIETRATETGYAWTSDRLPGRVPQPHGRARRAAPRDGLVVRAAAAREGARSERHADQRAVARLQVLRRQAAAAARLRPTCARCCSTSAGDGAAELAEYGGMSKQTVGVLLREMVELEQQGAGAFFGEPEFDLDDLHAASSATAAG